MATSYGWKARKHKTPTWAKNVYRATMIITTAISAWIMATTLIPENVKGEVILILKCIDPAIYGLAQLVGIEAASETNSEQ